MLTNDKYQNMNEIAGVEDLCNENAATVSGGVATLTDGFNGRGARLTLRRGARRLGRLNNRASWINISRGQTWRFWLRRNFRGRSITLRAGARNLRVPFNNSISSGRRIR